MTTVDRGAECYARFLAGDNDAFEGIVREYKNPLMLFLNGIVGTIHTAEDLTEDTFVRIVVRRPAYQAGKASFKTWLFTIGRNLARSYLRKHRNQAPLPEDEALEQADVRSIEEEYLRKEEYIRLHEAMDSLPPDYRQVLYLSYFEELNTKEISGIMKKRTGQVTNLLYRAKASLKRILVERGIFREGL